MLKGNASLPVGKETPRSPSLQERQLGFVGPETSQASVSPGLPTVPVAPSRASLSTVLRTVTTLGGQAVSGVWHSYDG